MTTKNELAEAISASRRCPGPSAVTPCPAPAFSFGVPFPWEAAPEAMLDGQDALVELFVRRADGLVPTLSLWDGLRAVRLKLWDQEQGKLITFADARASEAAPSGLVATP